TFNLDLLELYMQIGQYHFTYLTPNPRIHCFDIYRNNANFWIYVISYHWEEIYPILLKNPEFTHDLIKFDNYFKNNNISPQSIQNYLINVNKPFAEKIVCNDEIKTFVKSHFPITDVVWCTDNNNKSVPRIYF